MEDAFHRVLVLNLSYMLTVRKPVTEDFLEVTVMPLLNFVKQSYLYFSVFFYRGERLMQFFFFVLYQIHAILSAKTAANV